MASVRLIVVGAGGRGAGYASYALEHPDALQIVGVAEPRAYHRQRLAEQHRIPAQHVFADWQEVAARPRFADGVIIATPDQLHVGPTVAFANSGYHLLLEKPMAPTEAETRQIVAAVEAKQVLVAVCHVLRYTDYTQRVKAILAAGRLGEIISLQHLEPVGFWHQAHSFVRGSWRNEAESSFMLLAKSCHDMDWIRYIMDQPCRQVSSFGSLKHFRKAEQPAAAADRCLDCQVEATCPYSAPRLYFDRLARGDTGWPTNVLTSDLTVAGVTEALRTGPYGRCVYACDNDVVDHQVVNMQFADGATAAFTMTAFTEMRDRETRIFGTRGELYGNGRIIRVYDFLTRETETIDTHATAGSIVGGHGGGDTRLMQRFVAALAALDPSQILSSPTESLESHLMAFAAERARRTAQVIPISL